MTREEIDEAINEIEKNYHVSCLYIPPIQNDDFSYGELRMSPNLHHSVWIDEPRASKIELLEVAIAKLDKLDLIKF